MNKAQPKKPTKFKPYIPDLQTRLNWERAEQVQPPIPGIGGTGMRPHSWGGNDPYQHRT